MPDRTPEKTDYLPFAPAPKTTGPRPLAEILTDLGRPIHATYLGEKKKKGTAIAFIEWHTAARILDRYAPGWQWETSSHLSLDGAHVLVDGRLGIPTSDYGMVWRGATGSDEEGEEGEKQYGDASDRAEAQAYKRACAKFRLFLYSYYEHGTNGKTQTNPPSASQPVNIVILPTSAADGIAPGTADFRKALPAAPAPPTATARVKRPAPTGPVVAEEVARREVSNFIRGSGEIFADDAEELRALTTMLKVSTGRPQATPSNTLPQEWRELADAIRRGDIDVPGEAFR